MHVGQRSPHHALQSQHQPGSDIASGEPTSRAVTVAVQAQPKMSEAIGEEGLAEGSPPPKREPGQEQQEVEEMAHQPDQLDQTEGIPTQAAAALQLLFGGSTAVTAAAPLAADAGTEAALSHSAAAISESDGAAQTTADASQIISPQNGPATTGPVDSEAVTAMLASAGNGTADYADTPSVYEAVAEAARRAVLSPTSPNGTAQPGVADPISTAGEVQSHSESQAQNGPGGAPSSSDNASAQAPAANLPSVAAKRKRKSGPSGPSGGHRPADMPGDGPFQCDVCQKRYSRAEFLRRHSRVREYLSCPGSLEAKRVARRAHHTPHITLSTHVARV